MADGRWPPLSHLMVSDVKEWAGKIRGKNNLIPQSRMEKFLFSFLNICRSEINPTVIVWVFYCLESLYSTKTGENKAALLRRIAEVLKPNEKQYAMLRKKLNDMYDVRSSLVHGGFDIIHPMHNERLDPRIDKIMDSIHENACFGVQIIIATTQLMIQNNWLELNFKETLDPISSA